MRELARQAPSRTCAEGDAIEPRQQEGGRRERAVAGADFVVVVQHRSRRGRGNLADLLVVAVEERAEPIQPPLVFVRLGRRRDWRGRRRDAGRALRLRLAVRLDLRLHRGDLRAELRRLLLELLNLLRIAHHADLMALLGKSTMVPRHEKPVAHHAEQQHTGRSRPTRHGTVWRHGRQPRPLSHAITLQTLFRQQARDRFPDHFFQVFELWQR